MDPKKGIDIADFPTIFQSLTSGRRTGTLKVSTDTGTLFFYFQDGIIRHFAQPARDDVLLRAMLHSSKIDRLEYDRLLSRHTRTGRSYHSLFSAKRSMSDADIADAMRFMVQEEVCDLFSRPRLSCEFFEGEPFPEIFGREDQRVGLSIAPEPVVMEAARRMDEVAIMRETVPSLNDIYTTTGVTEEQAAVPLPPESAHLRNEVLDLIDGRRDLTEIAELARMSRFDLMRTVGQLVGARMLEPYGAQSLLSLGEQYAIEGNIRKALRLYERAEELGENRVETRMHIARLYGALHDNKRAIAKYIKIAEDATAVNDLSAATAALRQALHVEPDNTEVRQKLVACLLRSDRYDETIIESIELSNHLLKSRDLDGAVTVWQSFMDKYPASTEAHRQLSELFREQDNKTGAIRILENLAVLYIERKRLERATEVYREILNFDPRHTTVRLKLASLLRRIGNIKEATQQYEHFRSTTRYLRLSDKPFMMLKSLLGLRNPAVAASARLALGGRVLQVLVTLAISLALAGIMTLIFSFQVSARDSALSWKVGAVLFESLTVLQVVILFAVLPAISSASVLFHPHEEEVGVATALALHPRAAVAGKFIATFTTWLVLLSSALPFAAAVTALGGTTASTVTFSFYMLILLGAVTSAALTLVSANAPDSRHALVDSYLACALIVATGLLIMGMLSDVSSAAGAAAHIPPTGIAAFQARTFTFVGTFLLMPAAAIFLCGMLLMGATARLMPERGYSGLNQKMFWFFTTLAGSVIGLVWASAGARASTLSQPPVARLLLLMSAFLALCVGAVIFPTESARGSARDQERLKQLLRGSRFAKILGPGPMRSSLFVLAGSALVLLIIIVVLGMSETSAIYSRLDAATLAALFFSLLGGLAMLVALGMTLSYTRLTSKRRRLILMAVLGIVIAVIPAAVAFLGLGLPSFMTELSPAVFTAAAFGEGLTLGDSTFGADTISWARIMLIYWIAAGVLSSFGALYLRKRMQAGIKEKGEAK